MDYKDEVEELLLKDYNDKIVRLLRAGLSWKGISNRELLNRVDVSESTLSKFLGCKFLSKKLYYETITKFNELYDPIQLFREILDSFDVIEDEIETQLYFLEHKQMLMNELNEKYNRKYNPYSGN